MTIDVGTGDGRAVLATATREPTTLALGLDANAASMAESSRRADPTRRGGLPNALFIVAAAEHPPLELEGLARHVTVLLPWGSLLDGCLNANARVAAGVAALLAPTATLELLLAPADRDGLAGLPVDPEGLVAAAAAAFAPFGLTLVEGRPATDHEVTQSHSTWARRLLRRSNGASAPGRTAVLVRLRSCAA